MIDLEKHYQDSVATCLTGSYFLSGGTRPALNIWSDNRQTFMVVSKWNDGIIHGEIFGENFLSKSVFPICISGEIVRSEYKLSEFCKIFPSCKIFACPIVEGLYDFGISKKYDFPCMETLLSPNILDLPYESSDYDDLNGDCWGKMANLVNCGLAVYNQVYNGESGRPFFNNFLTKSAHNEKPIFLVNEKMIDDYFNVDPISLKLYASKTCPVILTSSEKFKHETGCTKDKVVVFLASSFSEGTTEFMNFYKIFSGKDWCGICPKELIIPIHDVPLFAYNKMYTLTPAEYRDYISSNR